MKAKFVDRVGRLPVFGNVLRRFAGRFPEGSTVLIRTGFPAGLRWVRHHRYVNGYWIGHYELPIQAALARLLRPGKVFYDVGANAGFFSLLAARLVGPEGRVYAFDPLPENLESIQEQFDANGLTYCESVNAAVGDRVGSVPFSFDTGRTSEARLGAARFPGERTIQVAMTTLDVFIESNPKPDLVKVDVEGAESAVVRGAIRLIREGTTFLFEFHGLECAAPAVAALRSAGYSFEDLEGRVLAMPETKHHVLAYRPSMGRRS